jgi:glutamine amidotransferase
MQLLFEASDEGDTRCLGVMSGRARRFSEREGFPVPHMGWNRLEFTGSDALLTDVEPGQHVYFVHSYALPPGEATVATADYGGAFSAIVRRGNFTGTQFHPERSGPAGARILANFLERG